MILNFQRLSSISIAFQQYFQHQLCPTATPTFEIIYIDSRPQVEAIVTPIITGTKTIASISIDATTTGYSTKNVFSSSGSYLRFALFGLASIFFIGIGYSCFCLQRSDVLSIDLQPAVVEEQEEKDANSIFVGASPSSDSKSDLTEVVQVNKDPSRALISPAASLSLGTITTSHVGGDPVEINTEFKRTFHYCYGAMMTVYIAVISSFTRWLTLKTDQLDSVKYDSVVDQKKVAKDHVSVTVWLNFHLLHAILCFIICFTCGSNIPDTLIVFSFVIQFMVCLVMKIGYNTLLRAFCDLQNKSTKLKADLRRAQKKKEFHQNEINDAVTKIFVRVSAFWEKRLIETRFSAVLISIQAHGLPRKVISLNNHNLELANQVTSLTNANLDLPNQVTALTETNAQQQVQVVELKEEIRTLKAENGNSLSQNECLVIENGNLSNEISMLESTNRILKAESTDLIRQNKGLVIETEALDDQIRLLEGTNQFLEHLKKRSAARVQELGAEIKRLLALCDDFIRELHSSHQKLADAQAQCNEKVTLAEQNRDSVVIENRDLSMENQRLVAQNKSMVAQNQTLLSHNVIFASQNQDLKAAKVALLDQHQATSIQLHSSHEEASSLRQQLADTQIQLHDQTALVDEQSVLLGNFNEESEEIDMSELTLVEEGEVQEEGSKELSSSDSVGDGKRKSKTESKKKWLNTLFAKLTKNNKALNEKERQWMEDFMEMHMVKESEIFDLRQEIKAKTSDLKKKEDVIKHLSNRVHTLSNDGNWVYRQEKIKEANLNINPKYRPNSLRSASSLSTSSSASSSRSSSPSLINRSSSPIELTSSSSPKLESRYSALRSALKNQKSKLSMNVSEPSQ